MLTNQNIDAANLLFATVKICTAGSTTACQTIDHMQVDTGSWGVVVMHDALTGGAVPTPQTIGTGPVNFLRECLQYADGYVWGSTATVDVTIGTRTLLSLPINVGGDSAAGTAPAGCSGSMTAENSVATFGANGIIGIGYFLNDCPDCVANALPAAYYACPTAGDSTGCMPTAVPLSQQLTNPVGAMSADNNGVVVDLPAAIAGGQASLAGTLYFGIGTLSNNTVTNGAVFYLVQPSGAAAQTLTTNFPDASASSGTMVLTGSIIDSGSNAIYADMSSGGNSLPLCASPNQAFYCPLADVNFMGTTIEAYDGSALSTAIPFTVGNAVNLFAQTGPTGPFAVLPTLGGPYGGASFDWGLPFFYGRRVYVLFDGKPATGTTVTGPAVGF